MADELDKKQRAGLWKRFSSSRRLRDLYLFIPFVAISAAFWLIVSLNDDLQRDVEIDVEYVNVPDSVTFITNPPSVIHVNVRDKGTVLFTHAFVRRPVIKVDFRNYVSKGKLRVTRSSMAAFINSIFGKVVTIQSIDPDSISVAYTTAPAKEVAIRVNADITAALGKVISADPEPSQRKVKVYSTLPLIDTLKYVYTMPIIRRELADPTTVKVALKPIAGCRFDPAEINVKIAVEPLENRKTMVDVKIDNLPEGEDLMVFPRKVEVYYLVPMSTGDISADNFSVVSDYRDVARFVSNNIPVKLAKSPSKVVNAKLATDSVEYTLIHK
jgi:hypothetical protein